MPIALGLGLGVSFNSGPLLPPWLPTADGIGADISLDFVNNRAWNRGELAALSSVLSCIRSGTATYADASGVISAVGANTLRYGSAGLSVDISRTNVVLWNRDLTNAAWTKSNCTAAKDQTGPDGVTNSASSITATSANATCLQAITLASSARFQTCRIKRLVGTGNIDMTMDNGSTWTTITVTASWTRVNIPTQTLANPTVGFRIVTSGDAVAIDYVQNENGAFATSDVEVTTIAVTRSADNDTFASTAGQLLSRGTTFVEFTDMLGPISVGRVLYLMRVDGNNYHQLAVTTGNKVQAFSSVGGVTQYNLSSTNNVVAGSTYKVAIAYDSGDVAMATTAELQSTVLTNGSATMPTGAFTGQIGAFASNNSAFGSYIKSIAHWTDRRISNAGLAALVA